MRRQLFGFTLIELMITVTIIVILSGVSISAYLSYNNNQTIKNDARLLTAEILRAKNMAATLQYPSGCLTLQGVNIKAVSPDAVVVTVNCASGSYPEEEKSVLTSTTYTAPLFETTFLPGTGYVSGGQTVSIGITSVRDSNITKTITVSAYGQVSEN